MSESHIKYGQNTSWVLHTYRNYYTTHKNAATIMTPEKRYSLFSTIFMTTALAITDVSFSEPLQLPTALTTSTASYLCKFIFYIIKVEGFPGGSDGKESTFNARDLDLIPGLGRSLEKGVAIHSSILAWRIPWTEEPGRLQSMVFQRVGYDWATNTLFAFIQLSRQVVLTNSQNLDYF